MFSADCKYSVFLILKQMKWLFHKIFLLFFLTPALFAQNKADNPHTYRFISFYAIDKEGFKTYLEAQHALARRDYRAVYPLIKQMRRDLNNFDMSLIERSFEFWYSVTYTDFEKQLKATIQSTLAALDTYEERLRTNTALYFDHRFFLNNYLAYTSEALFRLFWFMSMERYFSNELVSRISSANSEGYKLFSPSEFYRPFPDFDEMLVQEEEDMKRYLGIGEYGSDTKNLDNQPLIPYSFAVLDRAAAGYISDNFILDDATQDLNTDREIRYLRRFLSKARAGLIWLVVRFDGIPFVRNKP